MRVNYILPRSLANGPGTRYTIWVQGCSIHCPGCSNMDTWNPVEGTEMSIDPILEEILLEATVRGLEGVTITGGEPLDQYEATLALLKKLKSSLPKSLSIFLTTGYTEQQIIKKGFAEIMFHLDILCVGPFEADKICTGQWKGSSNQDIYFKSILGLEQSKMPVILKEFYIDGSGATLETGFSSNDF